MSKASRTFKEEGWYGKAINDRSLIIRNHGRRSQKEGVNMGSDSAYGEPFYTDKKTPKRTRQCGDCSLWMTQKCPRETVGTDGRKYGPSMNTLGCTIFNLDPKVKEREEQKLKDVDG